ncbi:alkaline phosphatase PhoX [Nocardioides bigeumensis]|uniref:DUF839 domain-containing protein n=1 Tax=Nocardioides bigeumensis TaxID=433657 RepID=A0ABN2YNV9_9ACTN
MTQSIDRRTVLKSSAAIAAAGPFAGLVAAPASARKAPRAFDLVPVPDARDGKVRLHLPKGFSYRSFHDTEATVTLNDGTTLPGRHDGMGAFEGPDGTVILVRNHEVNNPTNPFGPGTPYDARGGGGTTTIHCTPDGQVLNAFTSLNGTMMNCSGGIMPWGSWVTCEETVNGPDVGPDFTGASNVSLTKPHGFVYEVPASTDAETGQSARQPLRKAGRFAHEAVSYDPKGGHLYLTEDNFGFPSGFYRYTPPTHPRHAGKLLDGGWLHMLRVKGTFNAHLEGAQVAGTEYDVDWVEIGDPDPEFPYTPGQVAPTDNNTALTYVSSQGWAEGAAFFSRLEGQVYGKGEIFFTSTQGGGAPETGNEPNAGYGNGFGQVWAYDPKREKLRCVYQSPDKVTLDFPDNITTSHRGTLVVCEDNNEDNFIRGLSPEGQLWDIALNRLVSQLPTPGSNPPVFPTRYNDEFAGSTFSPSGETLFVNVQASRGMTFAIWGPWGRIGV